MENKEISRGPKKKSPPLKLDEIDFDNLSFRPLTQGLGFHPEKKEIPVIKSKKPTPPVSRPSLGPRNFVPPKPIPPKPKVEERMLEEAMVLPRFLAFIVDLLIIQFATGLTLITLGLGAGLNFEVLMSILTLKEIILFTSGVFSIYFLFYFSILDLSTTVGKSLLGLEMKTNYGKVPVLKNSFLRSCLSLVSLPLLGMLTFAQIQDKLSETKIYKR